MAWHWSLAAGSAGGAGPIAGVLLLRTTVMGWLISSVFGSLGAAFQTWRNRSAAHDTGAPALPLTKRVAEKPKRWIDLWAERVAVAAVPPDPEANARRSM